MNEDGQSDAASVVSYTRDDCNLYVQTIYRKLANDAQITTKDHIDAVDAICKLQTALESQRCDASRQSQIRLICVTTSLLRRMVRMEQEIALILHYETDKSTVVASGPRVTQLRADIGNFERTATLVFIVIVTIDIVALGGSPVDSDAPTRILEDAMDRCLWAELCKHSKRRADPPEDIQFNEKQRLLLEELADRPFIVNEKSASWSSVIFEPGRIANAAVRASGTLLGTDAADAMSQLSKMARIFSQSTASQMSVQMLKSDRDFLSLATARIQRLPLLDREQALIGIAAAAESEAGQSVLRDLIVSFLLPRKLIGVRRTLLMSRETSSKASKDYPWVASLGHEVAMSGTEWCFANSKSELKKSCALLAGIAMLTTIGTDDFIRKAEAFNGIVQLPFLETVPPASNRQRIALVPTTRSWILYTISNNGKPLVQLSQQGFEGLVNVSIALRETI